MGRRFHRRLVLVALCGSAVVMLPAPYFIANHVLAASQQVVREPVLHRASELMSRAVYNDKGEKLGTVDELVLDGNKDHIDYFVLSYGTTLGMGGKLFAIPWRMVEHKPLGEDKLYVNIDPDKLAAAPGFDKKNWPNKPSDDYWKQVDNYFAPSADEMQGHASDSSHDQNTPKENGVAWLRLVSNVIGADVKNTQGESLGDVKDVVVECHTGDVKYAVLSFGSWYTMSSKLFAVPMDQLKGADGQENFVLDVSKDKLKDAPGFDKNAWPDFADPHWSDQVDAYYK
jgi:sporulation protein YlmC with PRC-barrel domain